MKGNFGNAKLATVRSDSKTPTALLTSTKVRFPLAIVLIATTINIVSNTICLNVGNV